MTSVRQDDTPKVAASKRWDESREDDSDSDESLEDLEKGDKKNPWEEDETMETDEEGDAEGEGKKDDTGSSSSSEDEESTEKETEKKSDERPSAPVPVAIDSLMPLSLPPGVCRPHLYTRVTWSY